MGLGVEQIKNILKVNLKVVKMQLHSLRRSHRDMIGN